jgi:hypothetical protein
MEQCWRTALVGLVIPRYFNEDRCHVQRFVIARLTHGRFSGPWGKTTIDATTFSPPAHRGVTLGTNTRKGKDLLLVSHLTIIAWRPIRMEKYG